MSRPMGNLLNDISYRLAGNILSLKKQCRKKIIKTTTPSLLLSLVARRAHWDFRDTSCLTVAISFHETGEPAIQQPTQ